MFPEAKYQRCTVHFYRNIFSVTPRSKVKLVAKMLKAIHAQEGKKAAREKAKAVVEELRSMKLKEAAKKVEDGIEETLTYCDFPSEHWTRIRTNNVIERLNREIRRRTRVVGSFPDGNSALMLVCARSIWRLPLRTSPLLADFIHARGCKPICAKLLTLPALEEAAGMISQMEFVRRVDVQTETIERYVREGLLVPDLVVPMSEHRTFKYFKEETLQKYAEQYGWTLIDDSNRKDLFLDMVRQMDISYSYKPVLLKAVLLFADDKGRVKLSDIVTYFREFYEARRAAGLVVEKANSIYAKGGYTDAQAQRNILSNPFKRFEDMQMLHHTKTLGVIQVDESVWKKLTREEKQEIERICDERLERYYSRLAEKIRLYSRL